MTPPKTQPLPVSWEECLQRGWTSLDILLVSGDAYVDHPSFGIALIARYLESHGYKVALLVQPRYDRSDDFDSFPSPRLFCGISAGNLDSIVANYSGNSKVRERDAFSPGGSPWRSSSKDKNNRYRPDRATILYSNLARSAFKGVPIVLGGVEASLRRFAHFDYKQQKIRASVLTDAKADLLVFGMGERAILEIATRCEAGQPLTGIHGSCERVGENQLRLRLAQLTQDEESRKLIELPSLGEILQSPPLFLEAELEIDKHLRAQDNTSILQKQQTHWVLQNPAAPVLSPRELDELYQLPFSRQPHPSTPDIPAFRMIQDSVTIVRGCSGNCSFCAITKHQGSQVVSRTRDSIVQECKEIASQKRFKGTISDLGGPTANLYGTSCAIGTCRKKDCLYPKVCKHLNIDEEDFLHLLREVSAIDKIKNVFISSGLRMELLLRTPKLLRRIVANHIPGAMKIAPEHSDDKILRLMHKEPHALLRRFVAEYRKICRETGRKEVGLTPYIISSHPGCKDHHTARMAEDMKRLGLVISKFQDFTPTPGTISTAMYYTGLDRDNKTPIYVPRKTGERRSQRVKIEHQKRDSNGPHKMARKTDSKKRRRKRR